MTKTVVLIYPRPTRGYVSERRRDIHKIKRIYAPLSIMYLTSTLERAGFQVLMLDHRLISLEDMQAKISKLGNVLFFGISAMTGSQIMNGLNIAQMLRENFDKNIPIVWGGVHPTIYPRGTIRHDLVDIIVYTEGDYSVVELARAINDKKSLKSVKGIYFKENGRIEMTPPHEKIDPLDPLPIPAWHHLKDYLNPAQYPVIATISTSRGCPYSCAYCYKGGVDGMGSGRLWRAFSVERVMQEVDYLKNNFGFDIFETSDENFILDIDRAIKLIRGFKDRGIKISAIRSHFKTYNDKVINELPGFCDFVAYSPETGSSRIQKFLNKQADYNGMKRLNAHLTDLGLTTIHNFIFGFPFETDEDIIATVNLCKEFKTINPASRMSLYQYMPYPGAPLTDLAKEKYGLVLPEDLEEWSRCDMYGDLSLKFRPWIKENDLPFFNNFQLIFNIIFNTYQPLDKNIYEIYDSDPKIRCLLGDIASIPRAVNIERKNILNERLEPELYEHYRDRVFV